MYYRKTWINSIIVLAALVIAIGLVVLFGWYAHMPALIQVLPNLVPMQYNTALCFVLSAVAIYCFFIQKFPWYMYIISALAFVIAFLTMIEYTINVNLHIDELFIEHYITTESSHPGRMAPSTAFCFMFSNVALFVLRAKATRFLGYAICGLLSSIVFATALTSLIGYAFSLRDAYVWGEFTAMALHTSIAFVLLSLATFFMTLLSQDRKTYSWCKYPIGLSILYILTTMFSIFEKTSLILEKDRISYVVASVTVFLLSALFVILILVIFYQAILSTVTLEDKNEEVNRVNKDKTKLMGFVSHEVRSPLQLISSYVEVMQQNLKPEKNEEFLQGIASTVAHIRQVIEDMLVLTRFETGKLQFEAETFSVQEFKEKARTVLDLFALKKHIHLDITDDCGDASIATDRQKLLQILVNFTSNAIKHSEDNGTVHIKFSMSEENGRNFLTMAIQDHGMGIPEEILETVFNPFVQMKSGDNESVGLGLTVTRLYADLLEGNVWFDTKANEGTTFYCKVPV